ncbi:MAG TPA: heparan-alpha-glucosaminide N-acetyltransferase domain-containing protein [Gemmatimonadaceae bacterium]
MTASPLSENPTPDVRIVDGPVAGGIHSQAPAPIRRPRLDSVDLLRGIVMVIMLLDHTRDFTHWAVTAFDPTNVERTWPALFFTRWITHFCAPLFVFLAGTGAYLQLSRGRSKADLSTFLVKRGLWLIVLEFTIVRFLVTFEYNLSFLGMAQVIWVLGVSMIVLGVLVRLPLRAIAIFGIAMIALHNLFDVVRVTAWQGPGSAVPDALSKLWIVLHQGGAFPVAGWPSPVLFVLYPLIPWIGVMAAGYALGRVYDWEPARRQRFLLQVGAALTIGFILLRAINVYGDPSRWSTQPSGVYTLLSFLNVTKYPPSLLFLLMTIGPGLMALAWFERLKPMRLSSALVVFGRVPLFFYMLQWLTAHTIGILLHVAAGKPWSQFVSPTFGPWPEGAGFGLGVTYLAWIAGVLLLYPICKWYAGVKQRRRDWWLSYM